VQQRVGSLALVGWARENGYECLILPLEYDPSRYELPLSDERALRRTSVGGDRRTQPGELLCPARISEADLPRVRAAAGIFYQAQYNQDPRDDVDRIVSREKFGTPYTVLPPGGTYSTHWDVRFKNTKDRGSWVVGWVWYRCGTESYLVAERRGRWGFEDTCKQICDLASMYAGPVILEAKANADAIEDHLRKVVPAIDLIEPRGDKVARMNAASPYLKHVHLPSGATWVEDVLAELERFPGEPNDRGDVLSQFLCWSYLDSTANYLGDLQALARRRRR